VNHRLPLWKPGFDGCRTPFDLGSCHGKEDWHETHHYRPKCVMTQEELDEYKQGYDYAQEQEL
jgi:hypothetical protein